MIPTIKGSQKLWIHGITGRMGTELIEEVSKQTGYSLIGGSSSTKSLRISESGSIESNDSLSQEDCVDLIIDVSSASGNLALVKNLSTWPQTKRLPVLIATTGIRDETHDLWLQYASENCPVLCAPNTSIGVLAVLQMANSFATTHLCGDYDIEITEAHHRLKLDSPSGTAMVLGRALAKARGLQIIVSRNGRRSQGELGIASIRGGGVFGEHQIRFLGEHDEITLTHRAFSRQLFARGSLLLANWLTRHGTGFHKIEDISLQEL